MAKHDKKIEALKAEQKRISAQMARLRASQRTDERKRDTRRKILVGAVVMNQAETNDSARTRLWTLLDKALEKDRDRELFGLKPREGGGTVTSSTPETSTAGTAETEEQRREPDEHAQ